MQTNHHQDNEFIVPSELKIPTDPLNYKDLPALINLIIVVSLSKKKNNQSKGK